MKKYELFIRYRKSKPLSGRFAIVDDNAERFQLILSDMTNFRLFQESMLKEFADDNFKLDKNDRQFFKQVKKMWEKEKLIVKSNFSFFCSVFKTRACLGKC